MPPAPFVLDEPDPPAVQLRAVQLLDRVLHVGVRGEVHDALVAAHLVRVRVRHLAGLPHAVLQVLPADAAREVLDDEPVLGARGWSVLLPRVVPLLRSVVSSAAPPEVAAARGAAGALDAHPLAEQLLAVQLVAGVVRVPVVVELDEGEAVFHGDLLDAPVLAEEPLEVALADAVGEAADEDPGAVVAHCFRSMGGFFFRWLRIEVIGICQPWWVGFAWSPGGVRSVRRAMELSRLGCFGKTGGGSNCFDVWDVGKWETGGKTWKFIIETSNIAREIWNLKEIQIKILVSSKILFPVQVSVGKT